MKELNISRCIAQKRKEKGITQEQLAEYMGVTKASVSKWESGQSYPDIFFLPELATYFNITVDELMGYSPQLTKEDIKKVYNKFTHSFATRPFDEVMDELEKATKEYYSCFPFLLSMVQLLLNHFVLADSEEKKSAIFQKCIMLCQRIKDESDVMDEARQANTMEAVAEMLLGNSNRVIELLGNTVVPYAGEEEILVQAYLSVGDAKKASEICQINIFQKVASILGLLTINGSLHMDEPELFEKIYNQGRMLIKEFELENTVFNSVAGIHIAAAHGFLMQHENEKSLNALEEYVDTVCSYTYPLKIRGNSYFDQIEGWIEENIPLGSNIPRDEITVKKSYTDILYSPIFEPLKGEEKFKLLLMRMEKNMA